MGGRKLLSLLGFPIFIKAAYAHCPLCTVGAAAAAGGAAYFGVSSSIIGIFIGAFAASVGWYAANLIKKQYIPYQRAALVAFSFLTTIIPLLPLLGAQEPLSIFMFGDYGSWFYRTYLVNLFLIGSVIGGLIVCITPWMSRKITELRNGKLIPSQGIILTFSLLAIMSILAEALI